VAASATATGLSADDIEARRMLNAMVAGDFESARLKLSPQLKAGASASGIKGVWLGFTSSAGAFKSMATPVDEASGQTVIVTIPLLMANGPAKARFTFNSQGQVLSFSFPSGP
jgi:hypothetical protein